MKKHLFLIAVALCMAPLCLLGQESETSSQTESTKKKPIEKKPVPNDRTTPKNNRTAPAQKTSQASARKPSQAKPSNTPAAHLQAEATAPATSPVTPTPKVKTSPKESPAPSPSPTQQADAPKAVEIIPLNAAMKATRKKLIKRFYEEFGVDTRGRTIFFNSFVSRYCYLDEDGEDITISAQNVHLQANPVESPKEARIARPHWRAAS